MTMTYKTVSGTVTRPDSNVGIRAKVTVTPLSTNHALTFTGDDRITVGPVVVETSSSGVLPALKIPTNVDLPGLVWRITAEAIDPIPGMPKRWTVKNAVSITGTGTALLRDLAEVDVLTVDATVVASVSDYASAADASKTAAAGSATTAAGWADAAASSAADADTSADLADTSADTATTAASTATTKATEASTSATTATTKASEAAASASHAEDMAGAAEAVAVSNDTIIAGRINDPASATATALTASIAQQAPKIARPGLKVLVDGDSIAAQCPTDAAADAAGTYDAYSWVEWANLSLHGRLSITANKGIGGQRSDQVLARIADSLDEDYDVAFLSVGTNDLYDGTGTTLATMKANITAIYQAHLNNGKQVVHLTPGPSVFATAPTLANHYDLMRYLRDYARDHAGIHLVESYSEAADPTDGKPLLNYCKPGDDPTNHRGVHPGYVWAARIGKAVANVVEPLAARIPVVESPSNADPRNVLTNGRMLGNTGGLATGYTVVKAADGTTATYTATKTARPDGRPGEVQQIVIPSVTWAAEQPQLFIQDTAPGGRWNVGDTVRLVVHLETDPDTAGSYPTASTLTFWNGLGALGSVGKRSADTTGGNALPAGVDVLPRRGVLRTTWGVIPTGTGRLQARVSLPYGTTRILSVEIQKAA